MHIVKLKIIIYILIMHNKIFDYKGLTNYDNIENIFKTNGDLQA